MALQWKDLERWSFSYLARSKQGLLGFTSSRYPIEPLGQHLVDTMNGYCIKPTSSSTPHKMLKLSALTPAGLDLRESKFVKVSDQIAERFFLRQNDLLICRSNAYEYVGKCAVVEKNRPDILFPDIIIRVRLKPSILPHYAREVIETPLGRSYFQINSRRAVGGMWKISAEDIYKFPIPLPPPAIQQKIVQQVQLERTHIAREREEAHRFATAVEKEVEEMLLGARPVPEVNGKVRMSA
jgi:type I restriction enzyme S subunit